MNLIARRIGLVAGLLLSVATTACSGSDSTIAGQPSIVTARAALASGAPGIALNLCTALLLKRPTDAPLLVCKGDALTALGRTAEAISAYEAALLADRGSGDAKLGLGRVALATDPRRAETLFLDALTSNPRNAAALNDLGIARDLQGRHTEAQAAYGEALAAAPESRAAQVNLALSIAMSGRPGEAVRLLRPIGERPDASARERHDLAAVLAMDGKSEEASVLLRPDLDAAQTDQAITGFESLQKR